MYRPILFSLLIILAKSAPAQLFQNNSYPHHLFRNPLDIPISLAANFGELRSNHYHMGLDIRTAQRENLPVYAAAGGYIYRVKIEPFGFGQVIYILHPEGYLSLYAHLNAFYPELAAWVKRKQYDLQRWDVTLDLPPGLLKVNKGDLIAYSGNTGGSQGPHLHFEIRTYPGDVNLNPMLFGLPVADNTPPVFRDLSVYDRNRSFYEQTPAFIPVKKKNGTFVTTLPLLITRTPNPGFGISGFDTQSGSRNPNGIFQGILYDNEVAVTGFQTDHISYDDTRGINAHIDYPTRERGGPYYQLLFRLPGYRHSIYRESKYGGLVHLEDGTIHLIRIELKDAYGNTSNLRFRIQYQPAGLSKTSFSTKQFYAGMIDGLETEGLAVYLGENCLYDSVHIDYHKAPGLGPDAVSPMYFIGSASVPLGDTMTVRIKTGKPAFQRDRILMQWQEGGSMDVKKPVWLGEWATAAWKNFGGFQLIQDTVPPTIRLPGVTENANLQKSTRILILAEDNNKKIKNFKCTLDGSWLLFSNDKERAFIYYFDEHCPPGNHELKIYAEDEAGNAAGAIFHFTR